MYNECTKSDYKLLHRPRRFGNKNVEDTILTQRRQTYGWNIFNIYNLCIDLKIFLVTNQISIKVF